MPTDPAAAPVPHGGAPSVYNDPGYGADPVLDAFVQPDAVPAPVDPAELASHHVTAILVAHNGERWLPRALAALTASDHVPDRIMAVNTGSRDLTSVLLAEAVGDHAIAHMPGRTGFGAAVQAGLTSADDRAPVEDGWREQTEWVWLLHDDCAPAADALRRLLECAVRRPDAAVIGPKVHSWNDERQLLEVGVSITGGGRRYTGLEKREYDQGQHDTTREVLAVGSAGMLVRRDVWDELGGFDKNLAVFRDDVDFGWRANLAGYEVVVCPDAVVQHAEAAAHGRRRLGATRDRAHLVDRRNALYVLLVNAPARRWLFTLVRTIIGGFGRAIGFLFGKQPALALEELLAVLAIVGRPDRIVRARHARKRTRRIGQADLRGLFPSGAHQLRNAGETVFALVTGTGSGHDLPSRRRAVTEPESEDDEPTTDDSALIRAITRPSVLLTLGLIVFTVVASRRLVRGGRLAGGALFPAPDSTADVWSAYLETWHGVGVGSAGAAPSYLAVIGALSSIVRSPSLVVDVALLGSVPLAGLTSYLLLRKIVDSGWLRFWGAAVYGLLPATTGAIAAGRLGTAVATVLTPLVALAVLRAVGGRDRAGSLHAAWQAGLLLAIVVAFVPLAWVAALLLAAVGVLARYRSWSVASRLLIVLAVPVVALAPWTIEIVRSPGLLLIEAGAPGPGLSEPALAPWAVLLQNPGGPGAAPAWLGAGVLLAAWGALFRTDTTDTRAPIFVGWTVACIGLVLGVLVSRVPVTGPTLETPVSGWPGYATVLVGGGFVVAATAAAVGLRQRVAAASFGWRQPVAVALVGVAGLTPALAAAWWLWRGADDPLERRDPAVLPAHVVAEGERPDRVRTLVLNRSDDGRVTYSLLRHAGPQLGDAETGAAREHWAALEEVIEDLVSGRGGVDASALADFAARYVYLPVPADPGLVEVLDAVPGLSRASAAEGAAMWQLEGDVVAARVRVLGGSDGTTPVESDDVTVDSVVPSDDGNSDRLVVLAEHADPGWTATLGSEELTATTYDGWAQAFELPAEGGQLSVTHDDSEQQSWLTVQLVAVLTAILLALPSMRRQRGVVDDVTDSDPDETAMPGLPAMPSPRTEPALVGATYPPSQPTPGPPAPPAPATPAPVRRSGRRARRGLLTDAADETTPRGVRRSGGHRRRAKGRRRRGGGD